MKPIIIVKNLIKKFGKKNVIDNVTFSVMKGEILGIIGLNGGGKTTLIKLLVGLLTPASGSVCINTDGSVKKNIGYLPQDGSCDLLLSGYENLKLFAKLYGLSDYEAQAKIIKTLQLLNLEKHSDKLLRTYSGGMVRKIELGQTLLHNPLVLFLDEPTHNLDPVSQQEIWNYLRSFVRKNKLTIIFTSHNLYEIFSYSTRVLIIDKGRIVGQLSSKELRERLDFKPSKVEPIIAQIYKEGV